MIAVTDTGLVPMRVSKALGLQHDGEVFEYMVLDERDGDRCLVIQVGRAEAFELAASLQGQGWGRPMTCQFTAALVRSLGGRVREVRLDRIVDGACAAAVEVDGPQGIGLVDARCRDALKPRGPCRCTGLGLGGEAGWVRRPAGSRFRRACPAPAGFCC
jgi:bifunctional DNase/RNase